MQTFHCATPEEHHFYTELERANLEEWSDQLMHDINAVYEGNAYYREFHKEWGHSRSNSGNGRLVARIPAKLFHMATAQNPNLVEDDQAWTHFINTFPGLEVKPS